MSPSILIVDDHAAFRAAARLMAELAGFRVAGEAEDGASAIAAVSALDPDVVLLDVQLPDIDGIEVARRLAASPRTPAVVLTSIREEEVYGARIAAVPTRGFISKSDLSGERLRAMLSEPA